MPELPEVEYVRRELRRAMEGARIDQVILRRANLRHPFSTDFANRLTGREVRSVNRRAKYLFVELSSGDVPRDAPGHVRVVPDTRRLLRPARHLFRVRRWRWRQPRQTRSRGVRDVQRRDGGIQRPAAFRVHEGDDPRGNGVGPGVVGPRAGTAGPDVFRLGFARALAGRNAPLKVVLLDQSTVAGLGNIYACEALHVAKLSPRRRASTIATRTGEPRPQAVALAEAIRTVLKDAIANRHRAGGADRFRVYDHEGESCPRRTCGGTIKRIVQGGRSTFYCPACQK